MSEKYSLKGFDILKFIVKNKAKILGLLTLLFPTDEGIKAIVASVLVVGEEVWKYFSKENKE